MQIELVNTARAQMTDTQLPTFIRYDLVGTDAEGTRTRGHLSYGVGRRVQAS